MAHDFVTTPGMLAVVSSVMLRGITGVLVLAAGRSERAMVGVPPAGIEPALDRV